MTVAAINIDQALTDPNLLGAVLGDIATWQTWRTVLKAAFGVALNREEARVFASIAGERKPPEQRVQQLWAIIGRRGGKSRMAALICCYLATCIDHKAYLAPGEVGYVLCLAPTQRQAQLVLSYCLAILEASPVLRQEIVSANSEEIRLRGNICIAVHPANYRTLRGRTLLAVVLDESALFRSEESAQPDIEILRACVPALLTTKGMAIGISTPYGESGLVYEKHRDNWGKDDDEVLVVKGSSTQFNPTLDELQIAKEIARDPEANRAEYEAEFRSDLSAYVDRETAERCVEADCKVRPFLTRFRYHAFADPSGGQHDSFTLAVAHREGERAVLDATAEWKAPFDPASVVEEIVSILRGYRCGTVTGDRYASAWVESEFRAHGISYVASDRDKSQIFLDALPLLTSGNAVLLDDLRLVSQISQLRRETGRAGRDVVRKMRGGYDDLANGALGALVYAQARAKRPRGEMPLTVEGISGNYHPHDFARPGA